MNSFPIYVYKCIVDQIFDTTNKRYFDLPALRSSICMIMYVIFTPATANGYSHADRLPPCLFNRRWKDVCSKFNEN